jgi:hypothetical protein
MGFRLTNNKSDEAIRTKVPRDGSKLRRIFDVIEPNRRGKVFSSLELREAAMIDKGGLSRSMEQLEVFYGMNFVCVNPNEGTYLYVGRCNEDFRPVYQ